METNINSITSESHLVYLREQARLNKDWSLSDNIRDKLEGMNTFVFDTKEGQEVYYEVKGTREDLINKLNNNKKKYIRCDKIRNTIRH